MRIIITGGAGCLGSNLIEHWLPRGYDILVIDNFSTGKQEVLPEASGISVVEGSVGDEGLINNTFDDYKPDVVIHSAASYKDPDDWLEDVNTNVAGSINVARAAEAHGVKQLINFQTALCYGRPTTVPIPVTHPTNPFTSYGITKTSGERFMMLSGIPTISLRLANVTGPRLAIGPIPTFYKRLAAGQSCFCSDTHRDFLDMSDFLNLMDVILGGRPKSGIFNVSSGEAHSIKEIFDIVAKHLNVETGEVPIVPPEKDDVPIVALDPSETLKVFGWNPEISFDEVIMRQLHWYDLYGVSDVYSHLREPKK